jgi:endo-alpha-1,4-polygalactosaminidase (GH114 family)
MRVPSRHLTVVVATALLAGLFAGPCAAAPDAAPAAAKPRDARLARVHTFGLALGTGKLRPARFRGYDLVVVDGQGTSPRQVRRLHRGGRIVLGYLSVGTIERWRPWYRAARPYRLDLWGDWGEWYAAASRRGFRRLIDRRVAPALLHKRFDGLFLDNVDMVETHRRQTRGMRRLVRALARRVHRRGGILFAQNGETSIGPLLPVLDGWNREDVSYTYDFDRRAYVPAGHVRAHQRALRRIARRGLLVTATDYVRAGDRRARRRAIANACAAGALPFVSNIGLTRIDRPPARCPR